YKLTQGDISMLTKYATSEDEMGNKVTDYGKVAFLQDFMQRTGYPAAKVISAYIDNVELAMAQGAKSKEGAERAAMVGLAQKISGGGRPTKPTSQAAPSTASNTAPSKADARIRQAATGPKPGTLDSVGSSNSGFDSYSNTVNGLINAGKAVGNWLVNTGDYADPEDILDYRP
ncbi:MAG: hypothetical protein LUG19_10910, partial [Desulfovibrio sp.]|uniref:hypothetical protein n=1 Tax=Desulfovibrio sp. TaxID=885 RepID=UPI00258D5AB8